MPQNPRARAGSHPAVSFTAIRDFGVRSICLHYIGITGSVKPQSWPWNRQAVSNPLFSLIDLMQQNKVRLPPSLREAFRLPRRLGSLFSGAEHLLHFQSGLNHPAGFIARTGAGRQGQNPVTDARGNPGLDSGFVRRVPQKVLSGFPLPEAQTIGRIIQLRPVSGEDFKAECPIVRQ